MRLYLHAALQAQPVVLDRSLSTAVVAVDPGVGVLELRRHGLTFDGAVEVAELHFHVHDAAAADRTAVGALHMLIIAEMVDAVPAPHKDDRLGGGEHVFAADGAVTVGRAFNAAVGITDRNGHADAAGLGRSQRK